MTDYDPQRLTRRERHALTVATVLPRPIGWVSTVSTHGHRNLAPFSYFNAFASTPLILGLGVERPALPDGSIGPTDTMRNILDTGEFVVNLVDEALAEAMVASSARCPPDVDEFELAGVTSAASKRVKAPRVAESPVAWECVLYDTMELRGSKAHPDTPRDDASFTTVVLGEVVNVTVADAFVNPDTRVRADARERDGSRSESSAGAWTGGSWNPSRTWARAVTGDARKSWRSHSRSECAHRMLFT